MAIEASIRLQTEGLIEDIAKKLQQAEGSLKVQVRPEMDGSALARSAKQLATQINKDNIALTFEADAGSLRNIRQSLASSLGKDGKTVGEDFVANFNQQVLAGVNNSFGRNGKNAKFTDITNRLFGIDRIDNSNIEKVIGYVNTLKEQLKFTVDDGYGAFEIQPKSISDLTKASESIEILTLALEALNKAKVDSPIQGLKSSLVGIEDAIADFKDLSSLRYLKDILRQNSPTDELQRMDSEIQTATESIRGRILSLFKGDFASGTTRLADILAETGISVLDVLKSLDKAMQSTASDSEKTIDRLAEKVAQLQAIYGGISNWGLSKSQQNTFKSLIKGYAEDNPDKWQTMLAKAQIDNFIPGMADAEQRIKHLQTMWNNVYKTGAAMGRSSAKNQAWVLDETYISKLENIIKNTDNQGRLTSADVSWMRTGNQTNIVNQLIAALVELQQNEDGALERFQQLKNIFESQGGQIGDIFDAKSLQQVLSLMGQVGDAKDKVMGGTGIGGSGSGGIGLGIDEAKLEQIIQLMESLVAEIGKVSGVLGTIDENSDIPNIITQFDNLTKGIAPTITELQNLAEAVKGIDFNLMINVGGSGKNAVQKSMEIGAANRKNISDYAKAYEELKRVMSSSSAQFKNEDAWINALLKQTYGDRNWRSSTGKDIMSVFADLGSDKKGEQRAAYKDVIGLGKQVASKYGIDISEWSKQWEQAAVVSERSLERIASGEAQVEEQTKRLSEIFGGGSNKLNVDGTIEQLQQILNVLNNIHTVLADNSQQGFMGLTPETIEAITGSFATLNGTLSEMKELMTELKNIKSNQTPILSGKEGVQNADANGVLKNAVSGKSAEMAKSATEAEKSEVSTLTALEQKVIDVKTAVENKTGAFETEQEKVAEVVDAEVSKLGELETKLGTVSEKANIDVKVNHTEEITSGDTGSKTSGKSGRKSDKASDTSVRKINKDYEDFIDRLKSVDLAIGRTDTEVTAINDRIAALGETIRNVNTKTDLSAARDEFEALRKEINIVAERGKQHQLTGYDIKLKNLANIRVPESGLAEYNAILGQIREKVEALQGLSFSNLAPKEERDNVQRLRAEIEALFKSLNTKENKRKFEFANPNDINKWRSTMADFRNKNTNISAEAKAELDAILDRMDAFQKAGTASRAEVGECISAYRQLEATEKAAGRVGLSFFDQMKQGFNGLAKYLATFVSFYRVIGMFREGVSIVKEYNSGLKEMRKVTDESLSRLKQYQAETFKLANEAGVTSSDIQQSTADWLRLGESLDKASESAKQANILLNISEFENVKDATSALTSISKAYEDVEKSDIVDKLVAVGDTNAIAVDGLATGLQKSAASLKLAGADINEAMALVVGANNIIQNPETAGTSLRNIVLRLRGTKEGKEELEAAGEDIEGYIESVSKLQDTIKNATKVASNPNGIDILDSNKQYRNVYDILLEIANVYQEIVETDKKVGSNHAAILGETLGGKRGANSVADILMHPEQLEKARDTALHSEGTAQKELNAQLDSIDGKMKQLTNSTQEFWTTFLDQEFIKGLVDVGKGFVDLGTSINKAYKSIPIIGQNTSGGLTGMVGILSAFLSLKNNFGVFNPTGSKETGFMSKIGIFNWRSLGDITEAVQSYWADKFSRVRSESFKGGFDNVGKIESIWDRLGLTQKSIQDQLIDVDDFIPELDTPQLKDKIEQMRKLSQSGEGFQDLFDDLKEGEQYIYDYAIANEKGTYSIEGLREANKKARAEIIKQNEALEAGTLASRVASVGWKALSVAMNMALNMLIVTGIQLVVGKISEMAHATENATKSLQEFNAEAQKSEQKRTQDTKKVAELTEEYNKLAKGVDGAGNNNSLSNEDYDRYKSIISQLHEIMPDINTYFNAQGEAIGFAKSNLTDYNKLLLETQKSEADKFWASGENGKTVQQLIDSFNQKDNNNLFSMIVSEFNGDQITDLPSHDAYRYLKGLLEVSDIDALSKYITEHVNDENGGGVGVQIPHLLGLPDVESVINGEAEYEKSIEKIKEDAQRLYNTVQPTVEDSANTYKNILLKSLRLSGSDFYELQDYQDTITQMINSLNFDLLSDKTFKTTDDFIAYRDQILNKVKENPQKVSDAWKALMTPDTTLSEADYRESISNGIDTILDALGYEINDKNRNRFSIALDIDTSTWGERDNRISKLAENMANTTADEIKAVFDRSQIDLMLNGDIDVSGKTIDQLRDEINARLAEKPVTITLSEKFKNLENTGLAESLGKIKTAVDQANADGSVEYSAAGELASTFKNAVPNIEEYVNTLLNANTTEAEAKAALQALTLEYLQHKQAAGELKDYDEQMIASLLAEQGIANSTTVAHKLLNNELEKTGILFGGNMSSNIDAYKTKLTTLSDAMMKFQTGQFTSEDRINLINEFPELAEAGENLDKAISDLVSGSLEELLNSMEDAPEELKDELKQLTVTALNASKTFEKLSEDLDNIQSAYSSVEKAIKEYNETGMLSIDTVQELFSVDSKYFGLLVDEQGNLVLTAERLKQVTQARIEEMAIARLREMIDDVRENGEKAMSLYTLADATDTAAKSLWDLYYDQIAASGLSQEATKRFLAQANAIRKLADAAKDAVGKNLPASMGAVDASKAVTEAASNALKYGIDQVKEGLQEISDEITLIGNKLDLTFSNDFVERLELTAEKFSKAEEYGRGLREEFERLAAIEPTTADEAQQLQSRMEELGNDIQQNVKDLRQYSIDLAQLRMDAITNTANDTNEHLQRGLNVISNSIQALSGKNLLGFNFNMFPVIPKDVVNQQRRINDKLIKEEERYQKAIWKIRKKYLDLEKAEKDRDTSGGYSSSTLSGGAVSGRSSGGSSSGGSGYGNSGSGSGGYGSSSSYNPVNKNADTSKIGEYGYGRKAVIAAARDMLGFIEGPGEANPFSKYGHDTKRWIADEAEYWCNDFVSWCLDMAQIPDDVPRGPFTFAGSSFDSISGGTAGEFKKSGRLKDPRKYTPKPGDLAYYYNNGSGHVEIVTEVYDDGTVKTIGGNTGGSSGDRVAERKRSDRPVAYGTYDVDDGWVAEKYSGTKSSNLEQAFTNLHDSLDRAIDKLQNRSESLDKVTLTYSEQANKQALFNANADKSKFDRQDIVNELTKLEESQIKQVLNERFVGHSFTDTDNVTRTSIINKDNVDLWAKAFYEGQEKTGISALLPLATAAQESGYGASKIAYNKNNLWGAGARNDDPEGHAIVFGKDTAPQDYMNYLLARWYKSDIDATYGQGHGFKTIHDIGQGGTDGNAQGDQAYSQSSPGTANLAWRQNVTKLMGDFYDVAKTVEVSTAEATGEFKESTKEISLHGARNGDTMIKLSDLFSDYAKEYAKNSTEDIKYSTRTYELLKDGSTRKAVSGQDYWIYDKEGISTNLSLADALSNIDDYYVSGNIDNLHIETMIKENDKVVEGTTAEADLPSSAFDKVHSIAISAYQKFVDSLADTPLPSNVQEQVDVSDKYLDSLVKEFGDAKRKGDALLKEWNAVKVEKFISDADGFLQKAGRDYVIVDKDTNKATELTYDEVFSGVYPHASQFKLVPFNKGIQESRNAYLVNKTGSQFIDSVDTFFEDPPSEEDIKKYKKEFQDLVGKEYIDTGIDILQDISPFPDKDDTSVKAERSAEIGKKIGSILGDIGKGVADAVKEISQASQEASNPPPPEADNKVVAQAEKQTDNIFNAQNVSKAFDKFVSGLTSLNDKFETTAEAADYAADSFKSFEKGEAGFGRAAMVAFAESQVGVREGPNNQNPFSEYGYQKGGWAKQAAEAWCNDFYSTVLDAANMPDFVPRGSYTMDSGRTYGIVSGGTAGQFKALGLLRNPAEYTAQPGDAAYYWHEDHGHVEMVYGYDEQGNLITIGGNIGEPEGVHKHVLDEKPVAFGTFDVEDGWVSKEYGGKGDPVLLAKAAEEAARKQAEEMRLDLESRSGFTDLDKNASENGEQANGEKIEEFGKSAVDIINTSFEDIKKNTKTASDGIVDNVDKVSDKIQTVADNIKTSVENAAQETVKAANVISSSSGGSGGSGGSSSPSKASSASSSSKKSSSSSGSSKKSSSSYSKASAKKTVSASGSVQSAGWSNSSSGGSSGQSESVKVEVKINGQTRKTGWFADGTDENGVPYSGNIVAGEEGVEGAILPDGTAIELDTGLANVPKGTQIIPHDEYEDIKKYEGRFRGQKVPRYAEGTVSHGKRSSLLDSIYKDLHEMSDSKGVKTYFNQDITKQLTDLTNQEADTNEVNKTLTERAKKSIEYMKQYSKDMQSVSGDTSDILSGMPKESDFKASLTTADVTSNISANAEEIFKKATTGTAEEFAQYFGSKILTSPAIKKATQAQIDAYLKEQELKEEKRKKDEKNYLARFDMYIQEVVDKAQEFTKEDAKRWRELNEARKPIIEKSRNGLQQIRDMGGTLLAGKFRETLYSEIIGSTRDLMVQTMKWQKEQVKRQFKEQTDVLNKMYEYYDERAKADDVTADELLVLRKGIQDQIEATEKLSETYMTSAETLTKYFIDNFKNDQLRYSTIDSILERRIKTYQTAYDESSSSPDKYNLLKMQSDAYNAMALSFRQQMDEVHQDRWNWQNELYQTEGVGEIYKKIFDTYDVDAWFDMYGNYTRQFEIDKQAIVDEFSDTNVELDQIGQVLQEFKKNYSDAQDKAEEAEKNARETRDQAALERVNTYLAAAQAEAGIYDFLYDRQQKIIDALKSEFAIRQQIRQTITEAANTLRANKNLEQWLDPDERAKLFNEEDYSALVKKAQSINAQMAADYEEYKRQMNRLDKNDYYQQERLTAEYNRLLEIRQEELALANKELEVVKKETELKNRARERDTQVIMGGRNVNIADPEEMFRLSEEAMRLRSEYENQVTTNSENQIIRDMQSANDKTKEQSDAIQNNIRLWNEMSDAQKIYNSQILPETATSAAILASTMTTCAADLRDGIQIITGSLFDLHDNYKRIGWGADGNTDYSALKIFLDRAKDTMPADQFNRLQEMLNAGRGRKAANEPEYMKYVAGDPNVTIPQIDTREDVDTLQRRSDFWKKQNELEQDYMAAMQEITDRANHRESRELNKAELNELRRLETGRNLKLLLSGAGTQQTSDWGGEVFPELQEALNNPESYWHKDDYSAFMNGIIAQGEEEIFDNIYEMIYAETLRNLKLANGGRSNEQTSNYTKKSFAKGSLPKIGDGGSIVINGVEYTATDITTLSTPEGYNSAKDYIQSLYGNMGAIPSIGAGTTLANVVPDSVIGSIGSQDNSTNYSIAGDIVITNPVGSADDLLREITQKTNGMYGVTNNMR